MVILRYECNRFNCFLTANVFLILYLNTNDEFHQNKMYNL